MRNKLNKDFIVYAYAMYTLFMAIGSVIGMFMPIPEMIMDYAAVNFICYLIVFLSIILIKPDLMLFYFIPCILILHAKIMLHHEALDIFMLLCCNLLYLIPWFIVYSYLKEKQKNND